MISTAVHAEDLGAVGREGHQRTDGRRVTRVAFECEEWRLFSCANHSGPFVGPSLVWRCC